MTLNASMIIVQVWEVDEDGEIVGVTAVEEYSADISPGKHPPRQPPAGPVMRQTGCKPGGGREQRQAKATGNQHGQPLQTGKRQGQTMKLKDADLTLRKAAAIVGVRPRRRVVCTSSQQRDSGAQRSPATP